MADADEQAGTGEKEGLRLSSRDRRDHDVINAVGDGMEIVSPRRLQQSPGQWQRLGIRFGNAPTKMMPRNPTGAMIRPIRDASDVSGGAIMRRPASQSPASRKASGSARKPLGVSPTNCANRVEKVPGLENPTAKHTSATPSVVVSSRRFAASIRRAVRNCPGGMPTAWWKTRWK